MRRDHPRIRGEHRVTPPLSTPVLGSSPHTRGAHPLGIHRSAGLGIIPAYAGSTSRIHLARRGKGDHPRIRGEHQHFYEHFSTQQGSSPHTRGAHLQNAYIIFRQGIIPAYAGSTAHPLHRRYHNRDHPRIRGEHCSSRFATKSRLGSSPHTRGALPAQQAVWARVRIIPAYAGSTNERARARRAGRDQPLIRGEHLALETLPMFGRGSSTHTRGALVHVSE